MGALTATLPGGRVHQWRSGPGVRDFLSRFKARTQQHMANDPVVQRSRLSLDDYLFGMARHMLTTEPPILTPEVLQHRHMFMTYFLLMRDTGHPEYPGTFADYIDGHDIEFQL